MNIRFAADVRGQITLSDPLSIPAGTVSIEGPGAGDLRISGNDASRLFVVGADGVLRISGLTLTHGKAVGRSSGGGEPGEPGEGGAIFNRGVASLTRVSLTSNTALGGSSFESHGGPGYGGAIYNRGVMTIARSLLSDNVARGSGDHDIHLASLELTGGAAAGGAIRNEGKLEVAETEFRDNAAIGADGTTIFPLAASVGTEGGAALGGAIFDGKQALGLRVVDSTFAKDTARAGSGAPGQVRDPGGDAAGGALFSWSSEVTVVRSTVVANTAEIGRIQGTGGQSGQLGAGGLDLRGGGKLLRSNTIAFDPGSADVQTVLPVPTVNTIVGSCAGAGLKSLGFNLDYRTSCKLAADTDLRNVDARLGQLGDQGGPTRTMPLTEASPGVDAGFAPEDTDQRGEPRPVQISNRVLPPGGNAADVGAFELQRLPELRYDLTPDKVSFGSVDVGTVSKFQEVTLANTGTVAIRVGTVTVGGHDQDEFSISSQTCASANLDAGQSCRVRVRFSPEDSGLRRADLTIRADVPTGPLVVALTGTGS